MRSAVTAALAAGLVAAACSSKESLGSSSVATGGGSGLAMGGARSGSGGAGGAPSASGSSGAGGATDGGSAGASGGSTGQGGAGMPAGGAAGEGAIGGAGAGGSGGGGNGSGGAAGGSAGTLVIYFVDTEGGQATVMKLPGGQVFVVDTGIAGSRDGDRIQAVLRDELAVTSVDYLLTTHYDADHVGGATYLNERTPVRNFLDHGDERAPSSYLTMANAGMRRVLEAGDTLDVGGVHFDFVSSAGELITTPYPDGVANPYCEGVAQKGESNENENSVGFILRFGSFDFVNLADLLWDWELRLACPTNLLGRVDLYLTTHHGLTASGAPPLVRAMEPLAAVMNNGPRKGGGGSTWTTLAQAPGAMHVWQLHQALAAPATENAPAEQIANLAEDSTDMAHFLAVTVESTGAFTLRNPRTNATRTYQSR